MLKKNIWKLLILTASLFSTPTYNNENPQNTEYTFAMIKPDAVYTQKTGKIIDVIEQNGFVIICMQKVRFARKSAELFYGEHQGKSFFEKLINYITSGPIIIMVLAKKDAIKDWRMLMGPTDSTKAQEGTIRYLFGTDVTENAVHGSDSPESAKREIGLFFPDLIRPHNNS